MPSRDEFLLGTLEQIVLLAAMRLGDRAYGEPTAERGGRAKRFFQVTANGRHAVQRVQDAVAAMAKGLREVRGAS